jgi:phosphoglycolate phosphatase
MSRSADRGTGDGMKLFLFDVDNTLLYSGGAGGRAMDLAFRDLYGVDNGFRTVEIVGRTDRGILRDGLRLHRLPQSDFDSQFSRFEERYVQYLPRTLVEATGGRVLPGVRELLTSLQSRPDARLGLATGNLRRGAFLKLNHYDLGRFFGDGGFGEDSEDRAMVVAAAIRRLNSGASTPASSVCVIGDTPIDVEAARANGARAVAVATGRSSADELARAGADLVFADFSDLASVLEALVGAAG